MTCSLLFPLIGVEQFDNSTLIFLGLPLCRLVCLFSNLLESLDDSKAFDLTLLESLRVFCLVLAGWLLCCFFGLPLWRIDSSALWSVFTVK